MGVVPEVCPRRSNSSQVQPRLEDNFDCFHGGSRFSFEGNLDHAKGEHRESDEIELPTSLGQELSQASLPLFLGEVGPLSGELVWFRFQ